MAGQGRKVESAQKVGLAFRSGSLSELKRVFGNASIAPGSLSPSEWLVSRKKTYSQIDHKGGAKLFGWIGEPVRIFLAWSISSNF